MEVIQSAEALRMRLEEADRVAFVPTMGNLHEGHLSLMRIARRHGDCVVASIFVNRLLFGPDEDFDRYPRSFEEECAMLERASSDVAISLRGHGRASAPQVFPVHPPRV